MKVVVIGFDGADWKIIEPLASSGCLLTFKKLIDEGVHGNLKSTYPPFTCPAWASMMTGKDPSNLGIYYFIKKAADNSRVNFTKMEWEKWNPIWDILSRNSKKICIINVPSAKARKVNGIMVSGPTLMGSEATSLVYPENLKDYLIGSGFTLYCPDINSKDENKYYKEILDLTENQLKISKELFKKDDWNFFMYTNFYTDQIQHKFLHYFYKDHPKYEQMENDYITDYYKKMDIYLSEFLNNMSDDTVLFIVSDHGHGPKIKDFNINLLLQKEGLLKIKKRKNKFFNQKSLIKISYSLGLRNLVRRIISSKLGDSLKKTIPISSVELSDIDWSKTKAFSIAPNSVFINKVGNGELDKSEYEQIREKVKNVLLNVVDCVTGKKIITKVMLKEEIYKGKYKDIMPDIYFEFDKFTEYSNILLLSMFDTKDIITESENTSSTHAMHGIFIAYGKNIKKNIKIDNAEIIDILPTILYSMGIPIPNDIDGKKLDIFLDEIPLDQNLKEVVLEKNEEAKTNEVDEKIMKQRLKELGYM